jgi:hypothetical protein
MLSICSSWLSMQKSRILSAMGGGGSSEPLQGLAAGMPPPTKKELAQALDVASRFDVHIAQVTQTLQPLQRFASRFDAAHSSSGEHKSSECCTLT